MPDYSFETRALARGLTRIAGVDEAGRGPLAGPVTAAAVVLHPERLPEGLDDSKALTPKKREMLFEVLIATAEVSIAHASVAEIDELNILRASHLAMRRAVAGLALPPEHVLIDGNMLPGDLGCTAEAIVKGDALCLSIAAASIAAKVARDRVMAQLAAECPGYGWETNQGYGSKSHIAALQDIGASPHHRRSFKPVHNILCKAKSVSA